MRCPIRRRDLILLPALLPAVLAGRHASAAPDPQELLAASDAIRNPGRPFRLANRLIEYRNGQQTADMSLLVYAKVEKLAESRAR